MAYIPPVQVNAKHHSIFSICIRIYPIFLALHSKICELLVKMKDTSIPENEFWLKLKESRGKSSKREIDGAHQNRSSIIVWVDLK